MLITDCIMVATHNVLHFVQGGGDKPVSDQNLDPFVIVDDLGEPVGPINDGDGVVLFNFRADRMVEISKAFEYEDLTAIDRERFPKVTCALHLCITRNIHRDQVPFC